MLVLTFISNPCCSISESLLCTNSLLKRKHEVSLCTCFEGLNFILATHYECNIHTECEMKLKFKVYVGMAPLCRHAAGGGALGP